MNYREFIEEIRNLLNQASSLFDKEEIHRDPAFRKWRHELGVALETIESENYNIRCDVNFRAFGSGSGSGYGGKSNRMKSYNQDLEDTTNELKTLIRYFDDYGESKDKTNSIAGLSPQKELKYPEKITAAWIFNHAPFGLWMKFISLIIAAFILGMGFSQTVLYKNLQQLRETETPVDSGNQETSNPTQLAPKK